MSINNFDDYGPQIEAMASDWLDRAERNEIVVGILGLGYVGLPLADAFVSRGQTVVGFDVDKNKIDALHNKRSYIRHISDEKIARMVDSSRFSATTDFNAISKVDAILLCVPTPLNEEYGPDLKYVEDSCRMIAPHLRKGQMIVLESTTWPGTSEEVMRPILEELSGLKAHKDFALAYSPEREDPGNENYGTTDIPKVVGANTRGERDMAIALYSKVTTAVEVSNLKTAEAVKLMENIYRLVNISLINELNVVFKEMGIDTWEVVKAAKTKPFGFQAFYPGPGIGGHCIPIDPFYLTYKAKEFGVSSEFIEHAGRVMRSLPKNVVDLAEKNLKERLKSDLTDAKVLVCGLAYKKNIDDMRESPSLHIIDELRARGAEVVYHDPYIPFVENFHEHPSMNGMKSLELTPENLEEISCVIITTEHRNVDYVKLAKLTPFIIDTRNATGDIYANFTDKIIKS
ncbi:MAG: nucleotide sugar dehydrogenase [Caulobacterales bacterium]|nr:nucleotide sugar dehydrogenase [Caulobacterales bacterium]MCA0373370.1 nucleotide sugar dehydrogenase [Pseudomonadota bacterium]